MPSPLSLADDDDTNSYENVLICEPKKTESGEAALPGAGQGGRPPRPGPPAPLSSEGPAARFTSIRPCVPRGVPIGPGLSLPPSLEGAAQHEDAGGPSASPCSPCRGRRV